MLSFFLLVLMTSPTFAAESNTVLAGTVTEMMQVDSYTYLKLKSGKTESWAAVPKTDTVKVGAKATVQNPMEMNGFESKTLKRKFDKIYFGTLLGVAQAAEPAAPGKDKANPHAGMPGMGGAMGGKNPHGAMMGMGQGDAKSRSSTTTTQAELNKIKVPKAEGTNAYTVTELFSKKADLKDKPVTVRGKVMKYREGILGKNWLHIQDGSGKVKENNFDVTVSTNDKAAMGDVVTVQGKVTTDKDIGAGYFYPILIEDAKVSK